MCIRHLRELLTRGQRRREEEIQEEIRQYWAYEREKLEEAIAAEERKATETPIEPYPPSNSIWGAELDQQERDDEKYGELYRKYDLVGKIDDAPPDVAELRRRYWVARMVIRRREIWDNICLWRFYREHHEKRGETEAV